MNSLHPRQVEAFRAVMMTGSMTAAAETLTVSQPAVSRLVRDLEHALRLTLFERVGSHLAPTPEAVLLNHEIARYFIGLDRIADAANAIRAGKAGGLRVAAITAFSIGILNTAIERFVRERGDVSISVHNDNSTNIEAMARLDQIDIGLVNTVHEHPAVRVVPFPPLPAVCVVPAGHRLAGRPVVRVADLAGERLIGLGPTSPIRLRLEAMLEAEGIQYERPFETSLSATACAFVARGFGVAVIDPYTAPFIREPGLVTLRFEPAIPTRFSIVYPAHRHPAKVVEEFATVLLDIAHALDGA